MYHGQIHELKCEMPWFTFIESGMKLFELRKNDRDFHTEDLLILHEWDGESAVYTNHTLCAVVTCVVSGEWLAPGYVALGIRVLS